MSDFGGCAQAHRTLSGPGEAGTEQVRKGNIQGRAVETDAMQVTEGNHQVRTASKETGDK